MHYRFAAIRRFVRRHQLHRHVPVDLARIMDVYHVHFLDLSSHFLGFYAPVNGALVIGVNENVHPFIQREVICHEVAHHLLGHPASLHLCFVDTWWYKHLEVEARKGAALMLLPGAPLAAALLHGWTLREVADHFEVTVDMVQLAIAMAGQAA